MSFGGFSKGIEDAVVMNPRVHPEVVGNIDASANRMQNIYNLSRNISLDDKLRETKVIKPINAKNISFSDRLRFIWKFTLATVFKSIEDPLISVDNQVKLRIALPEKSNSSRPLSTNSTVPNSHRDSEDLLSSPSRAFSNQVSRLPTIESQSERDVCDFGVDCDILEELEALKIFLTQYQESDAEITWTNSACDYYLNGGKHYTFPSVISCAISRAVAYISEYYRNIEVFVCFKKQRNMMSRSKTDRVNAAHGVEGRISITIRYSKPVNLNLITNLFTDCCAWNNVLSLVHSVNGGYRETKLDLVESQEPCLDTIFDESLPIRTESNSLELWFPCTAKWLI